MTHEFSTLSTILARCGEKVAKQALEEIKAAVNQAVAEATTPAEVDAAFDPLATSITTARAARRAKSAARRAAKKAQEATEPSQQVLGTCSESCGEAEAEQPVTSPSPSGVGWGEASYITPAMVQYLRRCPDAYLLQVLNTYIHLIRTGNLIFAADDRRYISNFLLLARYAGIIVHEDAPITPQEITNYFLDNPALPLPRAQRRALERAQRRARRHQN